MAHKDNGQYNTSLGHMEFVVVGYLALETRLTIISLPYQIQSDVSG
jgi:hypothetical protein